MNVVDIFSFFKDCLKKRCLPLLTAAGLVLKTDDLAAAIKHKLGVTYGLIRWAAAWLCMQGLGPPGMADSRLLKQQHVGSRCCLAPHPHLLPLPACVPAASCL